MLTELSADGTDYTVAPDDLAEKAEPDDAVQDALESLLPVSDPAAGTPGLTVRDMHAALAAGAGEIERFRVASPAAGADRRGPSGAERHRPPVFAVSVLGGGDAGDVSDDQVLPA